MHKEKLQNSPQAGDAAPLGEPQQLFILSETSPVFWPGRKAGFPPFEESKAAWRFWPGSKSPDRGESIHHIELIGSRLVTLPQRLHSCAQHCGTCYQCGWRERETETNSRDSWEEDSPVCMLQAAEVCGPESFTSCVSPASVSRDFFFPYSIVLVQGHHKKTTMTGTKGDVCSFNKELLDPWRSQALFGLVEKASRGVYGGRGRQESGGSRNGSVAVTRRHRRSTEALLSNR